MNFSTAEKKTIKKISKVILVMQKHQEHREARHTPSCGGTYSNTAYGYMIVKKRFNIAEMIRTRKWDWTLIQYWNRLYIVKGRRAQISNFTQFELVAWESSYIIIFIRRVRQTRLWNSYKLFFKTTRINCFKHSFFLRVIGDWNSLPKSRSFLKL